MGTWGSAGVWVEERQRYRVRATHVGGGVTGLGKEVLENYPDAASALAWIDGPQERWQDGTARWEKGATYEFRDGRWWTTLDNGVGATDYNEEIRIPLRLQLALGKTGHPDWERLIAKVDDAMGALPQEAPPPVDVSNALSDMHDENDRLHRLLYQAREALWKYATLMGIAEAAKSIVEKIDETVGRA